MEFIWPLEQVIVILFLRKSDPKQVTLQATVQKANFSLKQKTKQNIQSLVTKKQTNIQSLVILTGILGFDILKGFLNIIPTKHDLLQVRELKLRKAICLM